MSTIAFIGLGIMGSPMAVHLQNAGHDVVGYNRTPDKAQPLLDAGGASAGSVGEAVAEADVVRANGDGRLDHSALLRGVERLSGRLS